MLDRFTRSICCSSNCRRQVSDAHVLSDRTWTTWGLVFVQRALPLYVCLYVHVLYVYKDLTLSFSSRNPRQQESDPVPKGSLLSVILVQKEMVLVMILRHVIIIQFPLYTLRFFLMFYLICVFCWATWFGYSTWVLIIRIVNVNVVLNVGWCPFYKNAWFLFRIFLALHGVFDFEILSKLEIMYILDNFE